MNKYRHAMPRSKELENVFVWLDLENLLYPLFLRPVDQRPSITSFIESIRNAMQRYGATAEIIAIGDLDALNNMWKRNIFCDLRLAGVQVIPTQANGQRDYSDHVMIRNIESELDKNQLMDVIVIGSGDSGFVSIAKSAKNAYKKVVVVAHKSGMGSKLQAAADDIVWLRTPPPNGTSPAAASAVAAPADQLVDTVVALRRVMSQNNWCWWIHKNEVHKILPSAKINELLAAELLIQGTGDQKNRFYVTTQHNVVRLADEMLAKPKVSSTSGEEKVLPLRPLSLPQPLPTQDTTSIQPTVRGFGFAKHIRSLFHFIFPRCRSGKDRTERGSTGTDE